MMDHEREDFARRQKLVADGGEDNGRILLFPPSQVSRRLDTGSYLLTVY